MTKSLSRLVARMDNLYEYDREPVAAHKLQSGWQFAGLFAGEHVAATEFVIGPFFVLHGVTARDLILGLLIGNILAVLSWTFICAPIAVRTRLTLYSVSPQDCGARIDPCLQCRGSAVVLHPGRGDDLGLSHRSRFYARRSDTRVERRVAEQRGVDIDYSLHRHRVHRACDSRV